MTIHRVVESYDMNHWLLEVLHHSNFVQQYLVTYDAIYDHNAHYPAITTDLDAAICQAFAGWRSVIRAHDFWCFDEPLVYGFALRCYIQVDIQLNVGGAYLGCGIEILEYPIIRASMNLDQVVAQLVKRDPIDYYGDSFLYYTNPTELDMLLNFVHQTTRTVKQALLPIIL